jgi:hypothetical protein
MRQFNAASDTLVGASGGGGGGASGGVQVARFSLVNGSLICQSLSSMTPSLVNGQLIITMDSLS